MCGIIGVANFGSNQQALSSFFADATITGTVRGADGFGVYQVRLQGKKQSPKVWLKKSIADGASVALGTDTGILNDAGNCTFTIGHHRKATQGIISKENAHPFFVGKASAMNLIGVHNGNITGWNTAPDASKYDVDSEWLLNQIYRDGPEVLGKINGAAAVVWTDFRDPTKLNLFTNGQRPLHFARVGEKQFLIASEAGMLSWLAERNKLTIRNGEIFACRAGNHYSIDGEGVNGFSFVTIPKPTALSVVHTTQSNMSVYADGIDPYGDDRDPWSWRQRGDGVPYQNNQRFETHDYNRSKLKQYVADAIAEAKNRSKVVTLPPAEDLGAQAAATLSRLTEEEGYVPEGAKVVESNITRRAPHCTPEETKNLRAITGINPSTEVTFMPLMLDAPEGQPGVVYGELNVEDAEGKVTQWDGVMRNVTREQFDKWSTRRVLARAIGVYLEPRSVQGGLDSYIVCTHPTKILQATSA